MQAAVRLEFDRTLNQPMIYITSSHPQNQQYPNDKSKNRSNQMEQIKKIKSVNESKNAQKVLIQVDVDGEQAPQNPVTANDQQASDESQETQANAQPYQGYLNIKTLEGQKMEIVVADQEVLNQRKRRQVKKSKSKVRINSISNNRTELNGSHLEIQQKFKNFSEYAEHVSPALYNKTKRQQHEQEQRQDQREQAHKLMAANETQITLIQEANSQVRSDSGLTNQQRVDPSGFTTNTNRVSLFRNSGILSIQDDIRDKVITSKDFLQNDAIKDQPKYLTKQRGSLPANIHMQDQQQLIVPANATNHSGSMSNKKMDTSGLSQQPGGSQITFQSKKIEMQDKAKQELMNQQKFQQQIREHSQMLYLEKHRSKLKDTYDANITQKLQNGPKFEESDMNSVMMQIQMQKSGKGGGQQAASGRNSRVGLEPNKNKPEQSQTKSLHQVGVKTNKNIQKGIVGLSPKGPLNINTDIEFSLKLMKSLSPRGPGPNADISYYQEQLKIMQSMNEQLLTQQAQEAYLLERAALGRGAYSRTRRVQDGYQDWRSPRGVRFDQGKISSHGGSQDGESPLRAATDAEDRGTQDSGFYIDQIHEKLKSPNSKQCIDPIIEHSLENSEMAWLGSAHELGEWDETGENDEIIRKNNLKNAKSKRKRHEKDTFSKKEDKTPQGAEQLAAQFDFKPIVKMTVQGDQTKPNQFKGSKVQQNNSNLAMKQSASQALLIGSSLGGQANKQPNSPELPLGYKSPYKLDKRHIQQVKQMQSRYLSNNLAHAKKEKKPANAADPDEDNESRPDTRSQERERQDVKIVQRKRELGNTGAKQGVTINCSSPAREALSQDGGSVGNQVLDDSPEFRPFEIEDITTWIERKKKQVEEYKRQQAAQMEKYKNA